MVEKAAISLEKSISVVMRPPLYLGVNVTAPLLVTKRRFVTRSRVEPVHRFFLL